MTKETLPGGKTNTYGYDLAGNLSSFADAGGTVTYSFNAANELTTLSDPQGKQTTFAYDNDHNRTQTNYPNSVSQVISYDPSNRITSIVGKKTLSGAILTSNSYNYGAGGSDTGLRQSMTDGVSGATTVYGYDYADRLASAVSPSASYGYAYDADGNRLTATVNGVQTNATYNAADELTQYGSTSISSDADGNVLGTSGGVALAYNPKNQMSTAAGLSQKFIGSGQTDRIALGSVSYQNNALGLGAQTDSTGATYFTRDEGGALVSERTPQGTYYYLSDANGSTTALTDSTGNVVDTYSYDPYGKLVSSTGTVANPYRWSGQYFDTASGLYKIGARFYDPVTGRWLSEDTAQQDTDQHGANPFSYAGDDPINLSDPSGTTIPWDPHSYGAHAGEPCRTLRGAALRRCAYVQWSAEAYCSMWYCPHWEQSWSTSKCAGYAIKSIALKPFSYSLKQGLALLLGKAAAKFNPYTAAGSVALACVMHGFTSQYTK
jgi:RHS repeat-associated protein